MRTHYKNGDEITLQANNCDGCSPCMVNGIICHELGCPDMWRDFERDCAWCGMMFWPESRDQEFCSDDCAMCYHY